jgi:hypothetical protein
MYVCVHLGVCVCFVFLCMYGGEHRYGILDASIEWYVYVYVYVCMYVCIWVCVCVLFFCVCMEGSIVTGF